MTILLVGVCENGLVRHNASGFGVGGVKQWGVTNPVPCKKCDGKGCPKPDAVAATDAS